LVSFFYFPQNFLIVFAVQGGEHALVDALHSCRTVRVVYQSQLSKRLPDCKSDGWYEPFGRILKKVENSIVLLYFFRSHVHFFKNVLEPLLVLLPHLQVRVDICRDLFVLYLRSFLRHRLLHCHELHRAGFRLLDIQRHGRLGEELFRLYLLLFLVKIPLVVVVQLMDKLELLNVLSLHDGTLPQKVFLSDVLLYPVEQPLVNLFFPLYILQEFEPLLPPAFDLHIWN